MLKSIILKNIIKKKYIVFYNMSLLNFVKKEFNDRVESSNALAELSTISVLQYTDNKEVFKELYKDFNNYDLELTINYLIIM